MVEGDDKIDGTAPDGAVPAGDQGLHDFFQEFAAIADEKRLPAAKADADDDAGNTPVEGAEAKAEGDKPAGEGDKKDPPQQTPEEKAAADAAAAQAEADKKGKEDAAKVDLSKIDRSNLNAEQRAALDAAQTELHRLRSDAGRVPNLQREKARLETQLAALNNHNKPPATKPASLSEKPGIKKAVEDLPELAPIVAELDQNRQDTAADREASARARENAAFGAAHPDFMQHKKAFSDWIQTQPKDLQEIATRNSGKGITNSDEAIKLVDLFKIDKQITTATPAADPKPEGQRTAPPTKESERRQAQLDAARKGPEKRTGVDVDRHVTGFEADFNQFASRKDAKRKRA